MEFFCKRYIQNGDIVSLDAVFIYKGYHSMQQEHMVLRTGPEAEDY